MHDLIRTAWRLGRPPFPLAMLLSLLPVHVALAQDAASNAPLELKRTPMLTEIIPREQRGELSSFIDGDRISGRPDLDTMVEGNASLRRGDISIQADRLEYYQPDDLAKAIGNVRVNQAGNVYEGPELRLKVETFEGFFEKVRYHLLANGGQGSAERIDFIDSNRSVAKNATYTTCRREDFPGWMPAWLLSAATLTTDTEENVGVATDARLSFMGVTTPAFPSLSFPLSSDRKSGLLPPTIGIGSLNGVEVTAPYYWNIAPNRDATLYPTLMSKRGVNLGTEFRYLEDKYRGEVRAWTSCRPTRCAIVRDGASGRITSRPSTPSPSASTRSAATLNINRVSDDDYWRDFSSYALAHAAAAVQQRHAELDQGRLERDFTRVLSYQTLQYEPRADHSALRPTAADYSQLQQIRLERGFDFSLNTDYTRFRRQPGLARPAERRTRVWPGGLEPTFPDAWNIRYPEGTAACHRPTNSRPRWRMAPARQVAWCRPSASTAA